MTDLSLHSQLFRVYCYCIDLDHILVLVTVVLGGYYWLLRSCNVCCLFACDCKQLHEMIDSQIKSPWPLPDTRPFSHVYRISKH